MYIYTYVYEDVYTCVYKYVWDYAGVMPETQALAFDYCCRMHDVERYPKIPFKAEAPDLKP